MRLGSLVFEGALYLSARSNQGNTVYASCTDSHLYSIAEKIHPSEWTSFASLLGLSSNVLGDLREDVKRASIKDYNVGREPKVLGPLTMSWLIYAWD